MQRTLLLFDLDGTLLDTSVGIFETANYTMNSLGFYDISNEDLRRFVGPPLRECFKIAFDLDDSLIPLAVETYRRHYDENGGVYKANHYEGMVELLKTLKVKGFLLAVATLKSETLAIDLLKHFELDTYFEVIAGSDLHGSYTKADIIKTVMKKLNINSDDTVILIGDTPHDLEGSREADVDFVAVTWGFGDFSSYNLEEEDHLVAIIDKPPQLLNYLKG
ncbi:MAG: HAD-IA family hydrolase [Sphaerochaetaceae bacterium]